VSGEEAQLPDQVARERSFVRILAITIFVQFLGAMAIIPMLPLYIKSVGGSTALAGVVIASFFAAGVVTQYPVGRMADRLGHARVLVAALMIDAMASLGLVFVTGAYWAVVWRSVQGVCAGAAMVCSLALVVRVVRPGRRGRAFGAVFAAEIIGMAVGPPFGAIIGASHMRLVFGFTAVVTFAAGLMAIRLGSFVSDTEPVKVGGSYKGGWSRWSRDRAFLGAAAAGVVVGVMTGVYEICWTLLLVHRGASSWQVALSWMLYALPFALMARPSGRLADRVDRRVLALAGLGGAVAICTLYPFLPSIWMLLVLSAVEAVLAALTPSATQSLMTQDVAGDESGRVQGLFGTVNMAATMFAALLAGAAFGVAVWIPFVGVGVAGAVGLMLAGWWWRSVPGRVVSDSELFEQ
jgi:DHA1 family multidrug resistance protein-like MFS transporter